MQANGVRSRALFFGAVWTAAVAAVPAWFKSSAAEPIYLWTIGLLALGWAGILLHALAGARRAAAARLAAAGSDTRAAIDALALALALEMERATAELVRVDDLLGHAIDQLLAAFNGVSDYMRRHQRELWQEAEGAGGAQAQALRAAAERAADEVNGAVTALQFRDVVGQKLGHVRRELETLEQVMRRVREASAAQQTPAPDRVQASASAELAARVRGLLQELQEAKAASPVRQELMHAGEVDLF